MLLEQKTDNFSAFDIRSDALPLMKPSTAKEVNEWHTTYDSYLLKRRALQFCERGFV